MTHIKRLNEMHTYLFHENWDMANEIGYESKTTYWDDFTSVEKQGENAIRNKYEELFDNAKDNYIFLTELVLVLNHKIWEWYKKNEKIAKVYDELWRIADQYGYENLKGSELNYFYSTLD